MPTPTADLTLTLKDQNTLFAAYMPYILNGGLFVATLQEFELGAKVTLALQLMNDNEEYIIAGKAVWITPNDVLATRPAGVGVQIPAEHLALHNKIKDYLARTPSFAK